MLFDGFSILCSVAIILLSLAKLIVSQECLEVRHKTEHDVAVFGAKIINHGPVSTSNQCLLYCMNNPACVSCNYDFDAGQCYTYSNAPISQQVNYRFPQTGPVRFVNANGQRRRQKRQLWPSFGRPNQRNTWMLGLGQRNPVQQRSVQQPIQLNQARFWHRTNTKYYWDLECTRRVGEPAAIETSTPFYDVDDSYPYGEGDYDYTTNDYGFNRPKETTTPQPRTTKTTKAPIGETRSVSAENSRRECDSHLLRWKRAQGRKIPDDQLDRRFARSEQDCANMCYRVPTCTGARNRFRSVSDYSDELKSEEVKRLLEILLKLFGKGAIRQPSTTTTTSTTTRAPTTTPTVQTRPNTHHPEYYTPAPATPATNTDGQCGRPIINHIRTRIVGGEEVTPHTFPWQVAIKRWRNGGWAYLCGGTIVSRRVILTAAHCFDSPPNRPDPHATDPRYYQVIVGAHNIEQTESNQQTFRVRQLAIHQAYPGRDPQKPEFDFAMMLLNKKITWGEAAIPICLAETDVPEGTQCVVTGWGLTEHNRLSATLLQVTVPILSFHTCNDPSHYNGGLNNATQICAMGRDKDSCKGDSGGPLVCRDVATGRWYQHGVVSFGHPDCNRRVEPGIYARITAVRTWIDQHLSRRQRGSTSRTTNINKFRTARVEPNYAASISSSAHGIKGFGGRGGDGGGFGAPSFIASSSMSHVEPPDMDSEPPEIDHRL